MNPDQFAATSHGKVAYQTSQGTGLPVLMIYGNSTCPDVFRNQLHKAGSGKPITASRWICPGMATRMTRTTRTRPMTSKLTAGRRYS